MMADASKGCVTVVGAGFMGTVIASLYARYGYKVRLTDCVPRSLATFRERSRPIAASLVDGAPAADKLLASVETQSDLDAAVQDSFFVHEAINENLAAKQDLFFTLDRICKPDVVLATNTSSLRLTDVFSRVRHRDRVIGVHYITPAHIVRVVEVIRADFTPLALVQWARDFLKTIDRVGVVCTDTAGFLVNRIQYALLSEVYRLLGEGVASRDDIDAMVRLSLGPRLALWGPLLTEDLVVSKKTTADVWDYLEAKTGDERFRRPAAVTRFVEAGKLGAVSGEGWYRFGRDYASVVSARDSQLKAALEYLGKNDRVDEFKTT